MKAIVILILYIPQICLSRDAQKRMLFTYSIPENRSLKRILGFDEDTYLNFTELTAKYRYPTEEHTVVTEDGYLLKLFRILPRCNDTRKRIPVMLMHGLYDSSDAWILSGPQNALAYILSENCYDVWAPNHRGNRYSRDHLTLDPDKDMEFWNFSFDEQGYFDVPAFIDFIIKMTNQPKIFYVGHSQGCTIFFIAMSLRPEYNDKVQMSAHLGPIAWLKHIKSPIPKTIAEATKEIKFILDYIGMGELFARGQLSHLILEFLCQFAPQLICGTGLKITTGLSKGSISSRTLAVAFGHLLAGVSGKTLAHYGQLILSKRFQRYDEGTVGNIERYGTKISPNYNVSNIVSPVLLICGANDWVSTLDDIKELSSRLRNLVDVYVVPKNDWSHNNHIWGKDAPEQVFKKIFYYFNRFEQ